jgi:hypothetical protein
VLDVLGVAEDVLDGVVLEAPVVVPVAEPLIDPEAVPVVAELPDVSVLGVVVLSAELLRVPALLQPVKLRPRATMVEAAITFRFFVLMLFQ